MRIAPGALMVLLLLQALPATAGSWRDPVAPLVQHPDRHGKGPHRQREFAAPDRFERREPPRRMSDEERRDLRRDIDKAQREIYRPRRDR